MSSREYAADELRDVLAGMGVKDVVSAARYGSGHINDTFKVDCASGVSYILQRINTDIFDPDAVMANIRRVTEHIRAKGGKALEVVAYTRPWRLYAFIRGAHTVDLITEAAQAYKAANAFAGFQDALADLPAPRLIDIIPKFHNTVSRLAQLDAARAADVTSATPIPDSTARSSSAAYSRLDIAPLLISRRSGRTSRASSPRRTGSPRSPASCAG